MTGTSVRHTELAEVPELDATPYLSRAHAEWIAGGAAVAHRQVEGALVFADVSGFTPLTERLARRGKVGAEELTEVLNDVFGRLLREAGRYGGDLLKFGGDALLLLFTGPEHERCATAAAVGMQRALRPFRRMRHDAGTVSLRMSVGAAAGTVALFLVGDSHRELLVCGPVCTAALAMETAADAGEVLVHASLGQALPAGLLGGERAGGRLVTAAPDAEEVVDVRGPAHGLSVGLPASLRGYLGPERGEGEHRPATVAFVQFSGVDDLLARAGPPAVRDALHALVGRAQAACAAHEVTFLATDVAPDGGKLILATGAVTATGSDQDRMLRALLEVVAAPSPLSVRAGNNHGRIFSVDVGTAQRRTFTVMGDAVNLAARVMGKAPRGAVLATDAVLERTREQFVTERLEPFMVKGKSAPVHAQVVTAALGRPRTAAATEVLGRDAELAELTAAVAAAVAGAGRIVELVGEPGIGKSRLLAEFRRVGGDLPALVIEGGQFAASTPYFALRRAFRELIGAAVDDDAGAGPALVATLRQVAPELLPWAPLIAPVFGTELPSTPETDVLAPAFRRARLHATVSDLLARFIDRPTLVTIEDAHWLDDPSRELLGHLFPLVSLGPVSVCVTRRPSGAPLPYPPAVDVTSIALGPLSPEGALELLKRACEDAPLPPHVLHSLAERGAGNPLFLQQLLAAAREGGDVADLPDTVEGIITARIDRLPNRARSLLRLASVLGARFPRPVFERLCTAEGRAGDAVFTELEGFLSLDDEDVVRFEHALVREAAYEGLPYRRRERLHALAGELLERHTPDPEDIAEELSRHYAFARRYDAAWRYSLVAAGRARRNAAPVEAAAFLARALEAGTRVDAVGTEQLAEVWTDLGDVCEFSGQYDRAAAAYRQARGLRRDEPLALVDLFRKEGRLRERSQRLSSALAWYSRGFHLLDRLDVSPAVRDLARCRLLVTYGAARNRQGRVREAVPYLLEAVAVAARAQDKPTLAHAYYLLDWAFTWLGDPRCLEYRPLALPIYEELGDIAGQANALNTLSLNAWQEGMWPESLEYGRRFREACAKVGDMVQVGTAANNRGELLFDRGDYEESEALFREARSMWRSFRFPVGIALATSNLGRLCAFTARSDEAEKLLADARAQFTAIGTVNFVYETEGRDVERLLLLGHAAAARELVERAHRSVTGLGRIPIVLSWLERLWGCALAQLGDFDGAAAKFRSSLEHSAAARAAFDTAMTYEAIGRLALVRGDRDDAASARAAETFARLAVTRPPTVPLVAP
jgi:class 3 adenylate cyclase/tetratricopeptide (TPR) repeat protein